MINFCPVIGSGLAWRQIEGFTYWWNWIPNQFQPFKKRVVYMRGQFFCIGRKKISDTIKIQNCNSHISESGRIVKALFHVCFLPTTFFAVCCVNQRRWNMEGWTVLRENTQTSKHWRWSGKKKPTDTRCSRSRRSSRCSRSGRSTIDPADTRCCCSDNTAWDEGTCFNAWVKKNV